MNRYWMYIFVGALFEVIWVTGFKHAETPLSWTLTIAALGFSFYLVVAASLKLPVGTVYAVYTGLGTIGTVVTEMCLFHEPVQPTKLVLIAMLLIGVIGLKLVDGSSAVKEAQ